VPFKISPQKYTSSVSSVTFGSENPVTVGGENTLPFYTFDGETVNAPKVGILLTERDDEKECPGIKSLYEGADTIGERARRAAAVPGVDFICLSLACADPNGENKPVEYCVELCREVLEAVSIPLAVDGCHNLEKDPPLFEKIAANFPAANILFLSAKEENYKAAAAATSIAYNHKITAESSVDINLAKQLNVLITKLGVKPEDLVMNLGSAAAGYGFEYVVSTLDRVKLAVLEQGDAMLSMPVITPIAEDAWSVKESILSEEEAPEWGPREERGIEMEIVTASACLASGSNAVILKHPEAVKTISEFINLLI
jgi:acetyl-CoA decarbonylase/synthase complex subunit delta